MSDDERYVVTVYENFLSQGMSEDDAEKATKEHMENIKSMDKDVDLGMIISW